MEIAGLKYFYIYMNAHYGEGWTLVGGGAAWEHIINASDLNDLGSEDAYKNIKPDDLDVLTAGDVKDRNITVQCSDKSFKVQFVDAPSTETAQALCKSAKVVRGARVLREQDIINKYETGTSEKAAVRQTRSALLRMIIDKQRVSPDIEQEVYKATVKKLTADPFKGNPFAGAQARLRPMSERLAVSSQATASSSK